MQAAPGETQAAPGETQAAPGETQAAPGETPAAPGEPRAAPGGTLAAAMQLAIALLTAGLDSAELEPGPWTSSSRSTRISYAWDIKTVRMPGQPITVGYRRVRTCCGRGSGSFAQRMMDAANTRCSWTSDRYLRGHLAASTGSGMMSTSDTREPGPSS